MTDLLEEVSYLRMLIRQAERRVKHLCSPAEEYWGTDSNNVWVHTLQKCLEHCCEGEAGKWQDGQTDPGCLCPSADSGLR